jgi:hypothetical protein
MQNQDLSGVILLRPFTLEFLSLVCRKFKIILVTKLGKRFIEFILQKLDINSNIEKIIEEEVPLSKRVKL